MKTSFCLVKPLADKFRQAIKSGEIDIDKLSEMTSSDRRTFFADMLGNRNAKEVNALFESKLLLKSVKSGMVTWAKQITGIRGPLRNTLIDKIGNMKEILSEQDENKFLQDLASSKLGTDITTKEATKIVELSDKIKELENYDNEKDRIKYGRSKIALTDYVNELNPKRAGLVTNLLGVPRTVMASVDLSAPLNQGWGMISRKEFYSALKAMFRYARNEENLKDLQADIITRPNYKAARKGGLRLSELGQNLMKREEQFMSSFLDRIPGISHSQRAYVGFLNKLRMDMFDNLMTKAEMAGEDVGLDSKVLKDIANVVNSFTGGASVGSVETAVPALNAAFFSPRKIKSTINMLNPMTYIDPKTSKTARKAAIRNLIGSVSMSAALISLARMFGSDEPEKDPRSTNFGKIKVGDTRVDVTGGNSAYAVLLARILSRSTKTQRGKVKKLGTGMFDVSAWDLASKSVRYKLSPNASFLVDTITGSNAIGEERTIFESAIDRFKPMFLRDLWELAESDTSGKIPLAMLALFGAGMNTYSSEIRDNDVYKFVMQYSNAMKSGNIEEKKRIRKSIREFNRKNKRNISISEIDRLAKQRNKKEIND